MTNRDMLKEAIADAKALKETAIANAKAALEEAFEPRLKSMLSAKLQEMEDEDLDEAEEKMTEAKKEYKDDDRKDGGESKETKRTEKMKYGKDLAEGDDEMDLDELLAELDEDARTDAEQEGYEDGMEDEKEDMEDMEDEDIDLEDMSEEDLKSFIEDVIADMVTSGELEAGEEFEVEDDEENIDVEDETEVDVAMNEVDGFNPTKTGDYELDRARAKGQLESKEDMEEGIVDKLKAVWNDPEMLGKLITVDGKKMSLKDFLGMAGSAAAGGMAKSGAGRTSSIGEDARTDAEEEGYLDGMKDEKEDMDKMKKEIKELRSDLHETNLLNAKLLYTNKIFRAKNLKEAQKIKVLEAFDKASNVKEVKLIFETLNEGMVANATTATPIRENLGRASKAAGMAPTKQPIMEIDPQVARWQKLAGIK